MLIIRRSSCTNTASGIVTLCKWPSGAPDGHLQRVIIPGAALVKFDLLMMRRCSKHVGDCNKHIKKLSNCASSWSFTRVILRCTVSKTLEIVEKQLHKKL